MAIFASSAFNDHEQVVHASDPVTGMRAIIAVHSTVLGPAIGGLRIRAYEDEQAALTDVLRLSKGMTYKAAVAGVPFGGGKMVLLADPLRDKTPALLHAAARAIERLGGRYVTGEDVGSTVDDMAELKSVTRYVMGAPEALGGSGDPSPRTALGCFEGIVAGVRHRLGSPDLRGIRVAVQGLGNVGWNLCRLLSEAGAQLVVTDVREELVARARDELAAEAIPPDAIYEAKVDVFAPCALGAVIDDDTLPVLNASIVAGGANNQLAEESRHGEQLRAHGILYAPDYVINGGGMIQLAKELAGPAGGVDWNEVDRRVRGIGATLTEIFRRADRAGVPTTVAAHELAQERLAGGPGAAAG
jgi:leucine dehydrogenase